MSDKKENKALKAQDSQETQEPKVAKQKTVKAKKKPDKKPFFLVRIAKGFARWFRELKGEAKKVVWPTGKQVVNNTIIVIIAVLLVAAYVGILDVAFGTIRDFIVQLI